LIGTLPEAYHPPLPNKILHSMACIIGVRDSGVRIEDHMVRGGDSDTSAIAFGHTFSYGFDGTGTIAFDPVEDGVLADNTVDFRCQRTEAREKDQD